MADDAQDQSLNVQSKQLREFVAGVVAEEMRRERDRRSRIAEIMSAPSDPRFPVIPPSPRKRRRVPRDKRWLHVVRGVLPAGLGAGFLRGHMKHAVITMAAAAVVTGGTLTPAVISQAPAAPAPRPYPAAHHGGRDMDVLFPAVTPVIRKRRRLDQDGAFARRADPAPSADPDRAPSPQPSPSPFPAPSPTVTPSPGPSPTCTPGHGNHCHGDDAMEVLEALRGLGGNHSQPWPGLVSVTSSVRNPGPRRDAGRTVMVKHAITSARRVASGRASHCCRVIPAWDDRSRAWASPRASSRSSPSRASIDSRRRSSSGSAPPAAWSAMAVSVSARWTARARNSPARPAAAGMRPGGLPGSPSFSRMRVITYSSRSSMDRCTFRHPGCTHP